MTVFHYSAAYKIALGPVQYIYYFLDSVYNKLHAT